MTPDYFLGVALGELGMGVGEFWEMRLCDFFLKLHFHYRRERRLLEFHAGLVRMQTVALLNVQLARGHRIRDPRCLWRFPWEEGDGGAAEGTDGAEVPGERDVEDAIKLMRFL